MLPRRRVLHGSRILGGSRVGRACSHCCGARPASTVGASAVVDCCTPEPAALDTAQFDSAQFDTAQLDTALLSSAPPGTAPHSHLPIRKATRRLSFMENNMEGPPASAEEARAALADLDTDATQLAARLTTPWWYHLTLGTMVAGAIGAQALPGVSSTVVIVLIIIGIPFLISAYTSRSGVSLTRPAGPRSTRMLLLILAVLAVLMGSVVLLKLGGMVSWWVLVPAVLGFVATVVLGRRYDAVLRSEISARAGEPGQTGRAGGAGRAGEAGCAGEAGQR